MEQNILFSMGKGHLQSVSLLLKSLEDMYYDDCVICFCKWSLENGHKDIRSIPIIMNYTLGVSPFFLISNKKLENMFVRSISIINY